MVQVRITQKSFNTLIDAFNHRLTKLETSTRWIKWILGYMAIIITGVFGVALKTIF